MHRTVRIASVTLGLVLLGAVAGMAVIFVAFVGTLFAAVARSGNWATLVHGAFSPVILAFLLPKGALLGALVGPPVAWAFLRRVPIGAVVVGSAVGALVGGVGGDLLLAALFWGGPSPVRYGGLWCALAGVLLAAVVLRSRFQTGASSAPLRLAADEEVQLTEGHPAQAGAAAFVERVHR
ncbi:hypothetical protein [Roseisolibacter sp. H3M3-2]|uniref:hypothetical protein n=1 Tax=Roseisolibacter sp. H3M3-2 TaxID=3031323 RepID=UPI0023D999BE|nr:hypothetical protein [Roseisolibacter sp. H3M3-2]MDF1501827.1 hypothetical protein [Roseisolibacter sp. H3M3-2]